MTIVLKEIKNVKTGVYDITADHPNLLMKAYGHYGGGFMRYIVNHSDA